MSHTKKLLLILIAVVFMIAGLIFMFSRMRSANATPEVETAPVTRGTVRQTVLATATVKPENKLDVIPSTAGRAETVEVEMGMKVKQGQVLLWMSSSERATMLDAARAKGPKELEFWKDVYKPTAVVAPLDGTIISRNVVPGQTVTTTTNVFVMSDRLIIEADLDETDLGKIVLDQRVDATLDGFPGENLHGRVYKIAYSSTTVNNVTTYKVTVLLDVIPDYMRSGMTANVTFIIDEHKGVLLVPASSVQNGMVFVPDADGRTQAREVKLGLSDGKMTEVQSGVKEGERVVKSSYKAIQAATNSGFSLMPKMPKRKGNAPPPP